jgi:hypothetical protein
MPHVARSGPQIMRLLAGAAAVLLLSTIGACGSEGGNTPSMSSGTPSTASTPTAPSAVSIPTGNLTAYYQCMIGAGWKITAVHSTPPGEPPQCELNRDSDGTSPKDVLAIWQKCEALQPTPAPLSEAEIRQVYDRWVGEYQCLVGLGYHPDSPPSVETFVATWKTGPWDPTFGVDIDHWSQTEYEQAKSKCTLEFYTHQGW